MASIWQFVTDMASSSPTVRLDLNSSGMRVLLGWKLGPTLFEKGYAGGPLRHGRTPNRSKGLNQVLEIPVEINKSTPALGAQAVEDLVRQLSVDNILKVQLDGHPNPVFYRTFGDADFAAVARTVLIQDATVTLSIEAEPFAYGPRVEVTGSPFTVSNNPALSNGCKFDITGVLGDVPSPLLLLNTSTGASGAPSGVANRWVHLATRRRGTPSNLNNLIQAESMTTDSADTTVTADAAMSGGSKLRCTFATSTAMTLRAHDTFPGDGTPTVEARGEYRVYARCSKTVAGDNIAVQFRYGTGSSSYVANDTETLPSVTGPFWVDLGKLPVPSFSDPVTSGFSGVNTTTLVSWVGLYAQRVSGSGSLDIDFLYFVPADDSTLIVRFPSTDTTYAIDGTTDSGGAVYGMSTALDQVLSISAPPQLVGGLGFPEVIPGQTNRIHWIRQVDPTGASDALSDTTTIRAYYWPRWREFTRP